MLTHFDFTISKCVISYQVPKGWVGVCDPDLYADLAARRLCYTGSDSPGGSLLRAMKYIGRGYSMPLPHLARLTADVANATLEADPTTGDYPVDPREVLRKLVEVDPSSVGVSTTTTEAEE